jgi:hypothetical protein
MTRALSLQRQEAMSENGKTMILLRIVITSEPWQMRIQQLLSFQQTYVLPLVLNGLM